MKSRWFLALVTILGLALFSSLSVPVAAETPTVKLVLGGTGATPWAIGNIAPGNSGTNKVTLSNTGFRDGVVTIWLSDIVNSEGANPESETDTADPGELGDCLVLNVSGTNLSTDFTLPAKISDFPRSAADTKHIYINPLKAFSTLNLQWDWRLPTETGNDVQGDRLSFTINYVLEEFPPISSPNPSSQGGPQTISRVGITNTGPSGVFTGFTRTYTLAVTNTGEVVLNDVVVTDYLPELLSYQSSIPVGAVAGQQITWKLGTLNIGATKEIVAILGGVKEGIAVNIATVTSREGVSATGSLNITVLGAPGAHMSLIDSSDPVAVGDQFTYTIKVLNQSISNDIHNLTTVGLVPGETVYVSADGPSPFTVASQEVRFAPVAVLKPGETFEFHIKVKATTAGAAVFNATMRWDEFGEPIVNQEGTTIFMPEASRSVQFTYPGGTNTLSVMSDSSTTKSYVANFFENKLTLQLDVNTKIALSNGQPPEQIEVKIAQTGSPSGEGKVIVSPIYQISAGYDASGNYQEVNFDRPVTITLRYDPAAVPQNDTPLYIACFEGNPNQPEPDWVRLDYPPGYVPEKGQVSGVLRHLSLFAVMAELAPSVNWPEAGRSIASLPLSSAPTQVAPANFEVRNLTVSPVQVKPGESISVNCEVINTGGQSGESTIIINIPGLLQTSQLIKLEAGQTQTISLTLPPSNPGTYQVDIGGAKHTFIIGSLPPVLPAPSGIQEVMSVWLILAILAVIVVAALVYYIVIIMVRRRKDDKLRHAPAGAVNVLAQTAEQMTLYATKHQKRVAELASAIAREMNLSKKLVKMLLVVGIIHDPASVELPYPVAQTALQYHERLNGAGYPQKMAGDGLLLGARILAVADTVETMSSPRPDRLAMGLDKALEEIKRTSSTLYDSEVVQACVRLVDRGKFRFQTLYD